MVNRNGSLKRTGHLQANHGVGPDKLMPQTFVLENFGSSRLGDKLRTDRLEELANKGADFVISR